MRIVLDANVYISAVLFGGLPELPIELARAGAITLLVPDAILAALGTYSNVGIISPREFAESLGLA